MRHVPVLLKEVVDGLSLKTGENVVDATLGDGGHAEALLEQIGPDGRLLGIDADPESLLRAKQFLYRFEPQVTFVRENFVRLQEIVARENFGPIHAVLMDFGWSMPQFIQRGRGLSFQHPEEKLDMRYGTDFEYSIYDIKNPTAADLLNQLNEEDLRDIFDRYGEEKLSREIARGVVERREKQPFVKVADLLETVLEAYRKKLKTEKEVPWIGGLHPATKTFQALRIVVNDELGVIEQVLPGAVEVLEPGGRLAIITFHSLEDRLVKHFFKSLEHKTIRLHNKKPIVCSAEEYEKNPPSRSAKLRIIEKI